eukprot:TRINITY_DN16646_c0_g1_i1.p1 TRINITY_DN16646_c0_g1~~TRINITY_DN16646_c0_g1_i1.p1  ORF type:complete len:510 (+),score=97.09 TRINITY_DN16646_c0_g1_i1:138-1667(+)
MNQLPREVLSLVADAVSEPQDLYHMGLACRDFLNGVYISQRWKLVSAVRARVPEVSKQRQLLLDRQECTAFASSEGFVDILRYLQLSTVEFRSTLPILVKHGHLEGSMLVEHGLSLRRGTSIATAEHIELPTPLHAALIETAVSHRHAEVVTLLCEEFTDTPPSSSCPTCLATTTGIGLIRKALITQSHVGMTAAIQRRFNIDPRAIIELLVADPDTILSVCKSKNLCDVLKYLLEELAESPDDLAPHHATSFLQYASSCGNVDAVRYLHIQLHLSDEELSAGYNFCLRAAAAGGHLKTVQYLHTDCGIDGDDVRALSHFCLRRATALGHLDVLKYLHDNFVFTEADIRSLHSGALAEACSNGHLDVVEWLHDEFLLTADDFRANDNDALCLAAIDGRHHILRYLRERVELTQEDARCRNNYPLVAAAQNGHLAAVRYLLEGFGLRSSDLKRGADPLHIVHDAFSRGHFEVADYLLAAAEADRKSEDVVVEEVAAEEAEKENDRETGPV